MNKDNNKILKELTTWVASVIEAAKEDTPFSVSYFIEPELDTAPFSIVAGWSEGFSEDYADLLCISKTSPQYAMCIKIIVNEGPSAYADFDSLLMPTKNGEVDDTCVALEWEDDPEATAAFYLNELERITAEHR